MTASTAYSFGRRRIANRMAFVPAWDTPIAMAPSEVDSLAEWVKALQAKEPTA